MNFIPGGFSQAHPALSVPKQGKGLFAAQGLLSPAAAGSQAVLETHPTATVTSCSFPALTPSRRIHLPSAWTARIAFSRAGGDRSAPASDSLNISFQALSAWAINLMGTHLQGS